MVSCRLILTAARRGEPCTFGEDYERFQMGYGGSLAENYAYGGPYHPQMDGTPMPPGNVKLDRERNESRSGVIRDLVTETLHEESEFWFYISV